jgi:hypothetical protein
VQIDRETSTKRENERDKEKGRQRQTQKASAKSEERGTNEHNIQSYIPTSLPAHPPVCLLYVMPIFSSNHRIPSTQLSRLFKSLFFSAHSLSHLPWFHSFCSLFLTRKTNNCPKSAMAGTGEGDQQRLRALMGTVAGLENVNFQMVRLLQ